MSLLVIRVSRQRDSQLIASSLCQAHCQQQQHCQQQHSMTWMQAVTLASLLLLMSGCAHSQSPLSVNFDHPKTACDDRHLRLSSAESTKVKRIGVNNGHLSVCKSDMQSDHQADIRMLDVRLRERFWSQVVHVNRGESLLVRAVTIPSDAAFLVFAAHQQQGLVTMSLNHTLSAGNHVSGRDVGLVRRLQDVRNREQEESNATHANVWVRSSGKVLVTITWQTGAGKR